MNLGAGATIQFIAVLMGNRNKLINEKLIETNHGQGEENCVAGNEENEKKILDIVKIGGSPKINSAQYKILFLSISFP